MRTDEAPLHVWVEEVMGIPVSVHLRSRGALPAAGTEEAVRACFDELHDIDRVFSPYLRGSDVSRICRGSLAMEDADHRVATIADACRQAEIETDGLFSAYWQGWFDPTGYVKGWAVEEAARRHLAPLMAQDIAVGINAGETCSCSPRPTPTGSGTSASPIRTTRVRCWPPSTSCTLFWSPRSVPAGTERLTDR